MKKAYLVKHEINGLGTDHYGSETLYKPQEINLEDYLVEKHIKKIENKKSNDNNPDFFQYQIEKTIKIKGHEVVSFYSILSDCEGKTYYRFDYFETEEQALEYFSECKEYYESVFKNIKVKMKWPNEPKQQIMFEAYKERLELQKNIPDVMILNEAGRKMELRYIYIDIDHEDLCSMDPLKDYYSHKKKSEEYSVHFRYEC